MIVDGKEHTTGDWGKKEATLESHGPNSGHDPMEDRKSIHKPIYLNHIRKHMDFCLHSLVGPSKLLGALVLMPPGNRGRCAHDTYSSIHND